MIANKDKEIRALQADLANKVKHVQHEVMIEQSKATQDLQTRLAAAESKTQEATAKMNSTIRAERAVTSQKLKMLATKHQSSMNFEPWLHITW